MKIEDRPAPSRAPDQQYRVIGTRPIRPDGMDKVTGRAKYGADIVLAGMLYGKVLRSPHAHARIVSIDASKALAMPGVHAVVTAADLPRLKDEIADLGESTASLSDLSENVLASRKVLYRGHAVAAVAANNVHLAEEALGHIHVEYDVLTPVMDVREAMKPSAPLLNENLRTKSLAGEATTASNIAEHIHMDLGDVEAGFKAADLVIEREFTTNMVHQGYIEPQNGTAFWSLDGNLTVWTSTQGAFSARGELSELLKVPVSHIKVIPMEIGGGFGGKIAVYLEPLAALLSKKTNRPVKLTMTRAEVLEGTGPTSGGYIRIKAGIKNNGQLTALQAYMAYEAGAFAGSAIGAGVQCIFAAYDVPNMLVDGYDVLVNRPKTSAYRAPGAPAACFACESVIDELAQKLNIDPFTIHKMNASTEGSRRVGGSTFGSIGNLEVLAAAEASDHWKTPLTGKHRGRGMASGFWFNVGLKSAVSASLNADGSLNLVEGSTDIGGTRASLAMQFAETLGVDVADVKPQVADTDSVGYNDVTGGSRTTYASGMAAHEAALDIKRKIIARTAELWKVPADSVTISRGVLTTSADATKHATIKELAEKLHSAGAPIAGYGTADPHDVGGAFGVHIADVEVDPDTGKVQVLRYTVIQDAGTAIHPAYVEGQMQGGAAQGIGWALNETYDYDHEGRLRNANLLDYRMPTTLDVPPIETIIVEKPFPGHPYGVRGVGEVPIVPPLAAIANAVARATGVRIRELPMSPAVVLKATGII